MINKSQKLTTGLYCFATLLLLFQAKSKALIVVTIESESNKSCSSVIAKLGCVIDHTSRAGKEQRIALEMAVQDHIFRTDSSSSSSDCAKLGLLVNDSEGNPARATASAIDLVKSKQVQAIVGTLTFQEAALVSDSAYRNAKEKFPFISLASLAIPNHTPTPFVFQIANDAVFQAQCIAALVGHFRWRKVTAIFEHSFNGFSVGSAFTLTLLSDSLRSVNSEITHHTAFPSLSSLPHPEKAIEKELQKLKRKSNRVFIVFQLSLSSILLLFEKAKLMGMMEKGYVWIISDEIASLLDSVDSRFKQEYMQGVIGIRTSFQDTSEAFKHFKIRFRRIYRTRYPEEEENSSPSVFALRAYDSITAIANAVVALRGKSITGKRLIEKLSSTSFRGLSGAIRFKNGVLAQSPMFEIINVDGRSYREIAFWSKRHGFSENFIERNATTTVRFGGMSRVYWPGGTVQTVPTGWTLLEEEKPLKIAIPAKALFKEYVRVIYDQERNKTVVMGFSIDVFEAAVKRLPYQLRYEFVPFNGTYDEMVNQVNYEGGFGGAVGDIQIFANRFRYVEFTQPYINSGLEMIVTVEPNQAKEIWMFTKVFSKGMWINLVFMHFFVCSVVWLVERQHHKHQNHEPEGGLGFSLWFCILLFSQRESLQGNWARIILAPWKLVMLVMLATFTASLSSMLTVSQIKPSILDIETLQRTNATVGCNGNSFIVKYLITTLNFKPENIKNFSSVAEYPGAFKRGEIRAAFFSTPHANVFLAKNCEFIRSGTNFKLGGIGFAFPKGSPLAIDISEAVIEVTESKEVEKLELAMLSSLNNCTSSLKLGSGPIGTGPFSVLLTIAAVISTVALLITLIREVRKCLDERFWRWAHTYFKKGSRTNALPTYLCRQHFN